MIRDRTKKERLKAAFLMRKEKKSMYGRMLTGEKPLEELLVLLRFLHHEQPEDMAKRLNMEEGKFLDIEAGRKAIPADFAQRLKETYELSAYMAGACEKVIETERTRRDERG